MTARELLTLAGNMPLHEPARKALIEAAGEITRLSSDRSNLYFTLARIGCGEGTAEQYSEEARKAIEGMQA